MHVHESGRVPLELGQRVKSVTVYQLSTPGAKNVGPTSYILSVALTGHRFIVLHKMLYILPLVCSIILLSTSGTSIHSCNVLHGET